MVLHSQKTHSTGCDFITDLAILMPILRVTKSPLSILVRPDFYKAVGVRTKLTFD